jgi:hypothetical protein
MGIDMIRVPPDMDETGEDGAFWFENDQADRQTQGDRSGEREGATGNAGDWGPF